LRSALLDEYMYKRIRRKRRIIDEKRTEDTVRTQHARAKTALLPVNQKPSNCTQYFTRGICEDCRKDSISECKFYAAVQTATETVSGFKAQALNFATLHNIMLLSCNSFPMARASPESFTGNGLRKSPVSAVASYALARSQPNLYLAESQGYHLKSSKSREFLFPRRACDQSRTLARSCLLRLSWQGDRC